MMSTAAAAKRPARGRRREEFMNSYFCPEPCPGPQTRQTSKETRFISSPAAWTGSYCSTSGDSSPAVGRHGKGEHFADGGHDGRSCGGAMKSRAHVIIRGGEMDRPSVDEGARSWCPARVVPVSLAFDARRAAECPRAAVPVPFAPTPTPA